MLPQRLKTSALVFEKLTAGCRSMVVLPREPIVYQGEVPRCAYFINSGVVKVYDIDTSGDEKIVSLSAQGEIIPTAWAFKKATVSMFYYEAFTKCTLFLVPRERVQEVFESDDDLARLLFDKYIGIYASALQQLKALEQSKGKQKILYLLHYLMIRFGKLEKNGKYKIDLRLTHQDIADMVGLTRETVSVELHKLRSSKVVSYKEQHYIVDESKMISLMGSDEFIGLKY